jgi:aspartate aminotransferase-like enzyme
MTIELLRDGTFFFPGPTEVRPEVLEAMTQPMIPHRGAAFETMFGRLQESLGVIFGTTRPVYVSSSSATGLMEAAVRCAPPGPVLSVVNGAFSARFANIARACGRETDVMDVPWGDTVELTQLEDRLKMRRYAAVTIVHSETSTGALTDVRTATRLSRENGALCLVDSVTGVGGAELRFDEWKLDVALTGSQKALALPPGLAFAAASADYIARAKDAPNRGLYFDLVEFEAYAAKRQTPNTPAIPLFYAADVQLSAIVREGMQARWARHAEMARRTYDWVGGVAARFGEAFRVTARAGHRSPTITSVMLPASLPSATVTRAVRERGYTIGTGYGKNRDTTIRIGHMGDHTVEGLEKCLSAVEVALEELGPGGAA